MLSIAKHAVFIKPQRVLDNVEKQYNCRYCGKTFNRIQALLGHIGRVHPKRIIETDEIEEAIERLKKGEIEIGYEEYREAIEELKRYYGENYKRYEPYVLLPIIIKLRKEEEDELEEELGGEDLEEEE